MRGLVLHLILLLTQPNRLSLQLHIDAGGAVFALVDEELFRCGHNIIAPMALKDYRRTTVSLTSISGQRHVCHAWHKGW
jgi:hypothetical protein